MPELVRLCAVTELPAEGSLCELTVHGRAICLAHVGGALSAMDNVCPHRGGPLAEGWVEEGKILCPWHAWAFDPKTGAINGSETEHIVVYPVRIEGEDVVAEL